MLDWTQLEPFTKFLTHQLHYAALLFMLVAYVNKVRQLLALPLVEEGTPAKGNHQEGIRYSFALVAKPWVMESQRRHWFRFIEFALFHCCIALAIGVAFVLPWAHAALASPVPVRTLQIIFGLATLVGSTRFIRRLTDPALRVISSPDDYFCILTLTLWFATGIIAVAQTSEWGLVAYFALATFFLVYVPFSKISHYLYWFFVRYYVGKHFGHRGVFPVRRCADV